MKILKNVFTVLIAGFLFSSVTAPAQEMSQEELEKAIQNPLAYLIFVPFENNTDFGISEFNRTRNELDIQPVLPFKLGKNVNLITRTIFPIITQPLGENESKTGLGDITLDMFITPEKKGVTQWGAGIVLGLPTATNEVLGTKKWTAGPGIMFIAQPENWTMGLLAQNSWSFAGDKNRGDINFFYLMAIISRNLPDSWYISTCPKITADWKVESDNRWTVPIGLDVGRLFMFGEFPINLQAGYYYYIVKPEGWAKWQLRAEADFILPKFY